jgi:hypothetical protein
MSFEKSPSLSSQNEFEKNYINRFKNRDKSLKWVNALFILIGIIGIPFVTLGFFSSYVINFMWGAEINLVSLSRLSLFLLAPFLSLFIPYFLNRGYRWAYWLGILVLTILVIFSSKEFLFHSTEGIMDIVRSPAFSLFVLVFVVWQLFAIKNLFRIQKKLTNHD